MSQHIIQYSTNNRTAISHVKFYDKAFLNDTFILQMNMVDKKNESTTHTTWIPAEMELVLETYPWWRFKKPINTLGISTVITKNTIYQAMQREMMRSEERIAETVDTGLTAFDLNVISAMHLIMTIQEQLVGLMSHEVVEQTHRNIVMSSDPSDIWRYIHQLTKVDIIKKHTDSYFDVSSIFRFMASAHPFIEQLLQHEAYNEQNCQYILSTSQKALLLDQNDENKEEIYQLYQKAKEVTSLFR